MRQPGFTLLLVACAASLTGCGTTYSLKEFSPQDGGPKVAFVDIKQRAVLSGARKIGSGPSEVVTCAEPSPDAMSSIASELALDGKLKDQLQGSLGFSQQEVASFVGLRTQTIQLLRDGMFRLCEGYMSGALTPADFAWLSRRYQRNMVALLTIEQLTRVAQVPVIAHASQGMAAASRTATAIQGDLEEIDKTRMRLDAEKKSITDEKTAATALPDTDTTKAGKLQGIQKRLDANQAAITRTDEIKAALLEGLKSAKGLLVSGATTVQIVTEGRDSRSAVSDTVAKSISKLTQTVLEQDDLPTLCFQMLDGSRTEKPPVQGLGAECLKIVQARADSDRAAALLRTKLADDLEDDPTQTAGHFANLLKTPSIFLSKKVEPGTLDALAKQLENAPVIKLQSKPPEAPAATASGVAPAKAKSAAPKSPAIK